MSDFTCKTEDTTPNIEITLQDGDGPVNIQTAQSVKLILKSLTHTVEGDCTKIDEGLTGKVQYDWEVGDTSFAGDYDMEVKVTWSPGRIQSFPSTGAKKVNFEQSLGAEAPEGTGWLKGVAALTLAGHGKPKAKAKLSGAAATKFTASAKLVQDIAFKGGISATKFTASATLKSSIPGILWKADGSLAGPANNADLEWVACDTGAAAPQNGYPYVKLVKWKDEGVPAPPGGQEYVYRYEDGPSAPGHYDYSRIEMANEVFSFVTKVETEAPMSVREWKEGADIWVAFCNYFPETHVEPNWVEDSLGRIAGCQWHNAGAVPPASGAAIRGTKAGRTPHWAAESTGGFDHWQEAALQTTGWYWWLWHLIMSENSSTGLVELWTKRPSEGGLVERTPRKLKTLSSAFVFPCMGSFRTQHAPTAKELEEEPLPTWIYYYAGWTFAENREAAEANAFGV